MAYALTPEFRSGCLTDKGIMRTYTWNSGTSQSGGAEGLGPDENGAVTGRYWLRGGGNECLIM